MSPVILENTGESTVALKILKCDYEWKIHKFSSFTKKNSVYRSQDFHLDSTWFVKMYPNGQSIDNSTGNISLYLDRALHDNYPVTTDVTFAIKTVNGIIVNERKLTHTFNDCNELCGLKTFILKSKVQKRKIELLPSDTLTIVCNLQIKDTPVLYPKYGKLAEDLKNLFLSTDNYDVTLNVKDKTFLVHKAILVSRSPVLAAMFQNEMVEKKTGIVNISDCDPEAFNAFLIFLYSGTVNFPKCNACELYRISDKYNILELHSICRDFMVKNMSAQNFCEILIAGHQLNDSQLLTRAEHFFSNNFEQIFNTKSWELLLEKNPRIANGMLKAIASKIKTMI